VVIVEAGKTQKDAGSIVIGVRKVQVNTRGHAFVYLGKDYASLKGKKILIVINVLD
jgi:hypothetical protein